MDSLQQLINSRKSFPLSALLTLYIRANKQDVYCDFMQGFLLLRDWLSPIAPSSYQIKSIPSVFISYEIQELAKHLNTHPSIIFQELLEIWNQSPHHKG
jgi:hypothetical protein